MVYQHSSSIAYNYRLNGLRSPTESPLITMFMKGLKRKTLLTKSAPKQAVPMTRDVLDKLNQYILSGTHTLREWRTIWRINVMFNCMLRWDDICRLQVSLPRSPSHQFHLFLYVCYLQVSDFILRPDGSCKMYTFELQGGKTVMSQRDPHRFLLEHLNPLRCPVRLTRRYFSFLGELYQGPAIPLCQPSSRFHPNPDAPQQYSSALQDLHHVLRLIKVDPTGYTEHSMRHGGATEAARGGATTEDIRVAGDWGRVQTTEKYIADKLPKAKKFNHFVQ